MEEKILNEKLNNKLDKIEKENVEKFLNNNLKEFYYLMKEQMKDYRNNIFIPKIDDLDEQLDEPYKYISKKTKK
jgi:hypothetical protein